MNFVRILDQQQAGGLYRQASLFKNFALDPIHGVFTGVQVATRQTPGVYPAVGMLAQEQLSLRIEDHASGRHLIVRTEDRRSESLHPERQDTPDLEEEAFHNVGESYHRKKPVSVEAGLQVTIPKITSTYIVGDKLGFGTFIFCGSRESGSTMLLQKNSTSLPLYFSCAV